MNNRSVNHKDCRTPNRITLAVTLLFLFLIACSNQGNELIDDTQKLMDDAQELIDQDDHKGAIEKYEQFVTNFPDDHRVQGVLFNIGVTYANLGNYKEARETFGKLLKRFPNSDLKGKARRLIAQSYRYEKKYDMAYIAYDRLTSKEFDDFPQIQEEAMYYVAYYLNQLEVYDEALGRYTELLLRFPHSERVSDAYLDMGVIFASHKKEYELARSNYNRALKIANDLNRKAQIQFNIAESYYVQGYFEKARTAFHSLLQEYEENSNALHARHLLAHIHGRLKEWKEAIKEYETIFADHRNDENDVSIRVKDSAEKDGIPVTVNRIALCYYEVGKVYYAQNDFAKAFTSFARILTKPKDGEKDFRTDPIAPFAVHKAMRALIKVSDSGDLGADVKSALHGIFDTPFEEPMPVEINDLLERFRTKYIRHLRDRDIKDDDDRLENTILCARSQFNYAETQRQELKRYGDAITEYEKILETYPPTPDPKLDLIKLKAKYYEGLCHQELSRPEDAVIAFQATVTLFNTAFQPLIDFPIFDSSGINKKSLDYCVKTALDYAEKACAKSPHSEYAEKACKKVKAARRKLKNQTRKLDFSDTSSTRGPSQKSQTERQLTAEEIAEIASGSTVFIKIEGIEEYENGEIVDVALNTGSGFFVNSNEIATNYHVIAPRDVPYSMFDNERTPIFSQPLRGTARVVGTDREYAIVGYTAIDSNRDLAILKVRAFGVKPLVLANSDEVHRGESVYAAGNPMGLMNVVTDGKISSIQWVESISNYGFESTLADSSSSGSSNIPDKLLMMTAPISPGNSGGPVLNSRGEVIGIAVSQLKYPAQNLNFAIPVNYLRTLLNRAGHPMALNNLESVY